MGRTPREALDRAAFFRAFVLTNNYQLVRMTAEGHTMAISTIGSLVGLLFAVVFVVVWEMYHPETCQPGESTRPRVYQEGEDD